jgi:LPXTG-site transpeptidase (sortase) family protein
METKAKTVRTVRKVKKATVVQKTKRTPKERFVTKKQVTQLQILIATFAKYKKKYLQQKKKYLKLYKSKLNKSRLTIRKLSKRLKKYLPILGLLFGIQLFLFGGWYMMYSQTVLSFQAVPVVTRDADELVDIPIEFKIHDLNISLPIIPVRIENGIWPVSNEAVTFLETSAYPTEQSNMVLYGHNRANLLKGLHQISIGDEMVVITQSGREHKYRVELIAVVEPSDVSLVLPTETEILTVYTCTGWFDSKRLVVQAVPVIE